MHRDPEAIAAVRKEGEALVSCGTWDQSNPYEKSELIDWANHTRTDIHYADVMSICSIKFWEMGPDFWKYKGRICYRGDNTRDRNGALAVFQEMSASPTSIHTANSNLAYGAMPGNKTTQADAIRAYVQAQLKSKYQTWVAIPKELWPADWHGKYTKPMCLLKKALYGHPESGGHWENHLESVLFKMGCISIPNHPSAYWYPKDRLFLTVYVDDLLLSGPVKGASGADAHQEFWKSLSSEISIEDPEELSRFLGRSHVNLGKL